MSFRRSVFLTFFLVLTATLISLPAGAKVLAEGKPSGGFYWQKVENKNGKVSYMCRSKDDSKIQNGAKCEKAGAKKP